jgi:hypothetical protein
MLCHIDGCDNTAVARRLCNAHYKRWKRHGYPLAGELASRDKTISFVKVAILYQGDACLLFPFGKRNGGYGIVAADGRRRGAHQIVCEAVHGPKPSPRHEVAHSCRQPACCNPAHLRWDTRTGNNRDCVGEARKFAKLTVEKVRFIRSAPGGHNTRALAEEFGVSEETIGKIRRRQKWAWLP